MSETPAGPLPLRRAERKSTAPARLLDVIIAGTGLVVTSPVMLIAALAIWIESGRPIVFSQRRIGQFGRPFDMYKFRKFYPTLSATGPPSIKDDPRLTSVGKFIELTKINELPQLWNVITGDMSMVGPRPETLNFADCFSPHYAVILDHKPGIFGPAQVMFRDEATFYPNGVDCDHFYRQVLFPIKASLDLAYFPRRTILSDIKWIVRGALAVINRRSSQASVAQLIKVREATL
jgi:lipopolysaccharide/colanic/teichoic acid biosynthesis glycosyltransferase